MHDDESLAEYERRLRQALHRVPAPEADADDVLARVEHGVRRRVRRRRVTAATVSAAAVLVAAAVVVPTQLDDEQTVADGGNSGERPTGHAKKGGSSSASAPGRPGQRRPLLKRQVRSDKAPQPSDVSVSAVATNDSGQVSVIGDGTCADGPCTVTGTPGQPSNLRISPTDERNSSDAPEDAAGIQIGDDSANSWAWTDALYATHDAGKTWRQVQPPEMETVEDVESVAGRVWAFGVRSDGRPRVASASQSKDDWIGEQVPIRPTESIATPMVVGNRVAFIATGVDGTRNRFVQRRAAGWQRAALPCPEPVDSHAAGDTPWVGCRTPHGSDMVTWSNNGGQDWHVKLVNKPGLSAVGGVDHDTAVVAAGEKLLVVDAQDDTMPVSKPYDAGDDVWDGAPAYKTVRISANGEGYAMTNGGAIARTVDGGRTWRATSLP